MNVELFPAVVAGLAGGVVMVLMQAAATAAARRQFDLLGMWATVLAIESMPVVGLAVHLAVSAAVAVLYAIGFRIAGAADYGWAWGLTGAVIHWVIAGSFLNVVPDRGQRLASPGSFAARLGAPAAVGFFLVHLAFGFVVGVVYFALHPDGGLASAF
jgi:hypothetical protein